MCVDFKYMRVCFSFLCIFALLQVGCPKRRDLGLKHSQKPSDLETETAGKITAVWANTGEDKVTKGDLRAERGPVKNSVWDGKKVSLFGGKNEVVAFNLILEAARGKASAIEVKFASLRADSGATISSKKVKGNGVFDWTARQIELFYVEYLQIQGLSNVCYENYYDERHVPKRFRRPFGEKGKAKPNTGWEDRPDHDKWYPDIAIPLELVGPFSIDGGTNQSVWVDVYIPKTAETGVYRGRIDIKQRGKRTHLIPIELNVQPFTLPDRPTLKTMLAIGYQDINSRYLGHEHRMPAHGTSQARASRRIIDRHFMLAHRHKISLIDTNQGAEPWEKDAPRPRWKKVLSGKLFTGAYGYDGPGKGIGQDVFCVGLYGSWKWKNEGKKGMQRHAHAWGKWFQKHAPGVDYFIFLWDEPNEKKLYQNINQWSAWINAEQGIGSTLLSFSTVSIPIAKANMPALDVPCTATAVGISEEWESAFQQYRSMPGKRVWMYGGFRPVSGTICTEDDGVAMRQLAWTQFKKRIQRWFIWESTYYNNFQCGDHSGGQTNLFRQARTFGCDQSFDTMVGRKGSNYSNGDGVLFYPGTDRLFPYPDAQAPISVEGPFASLRLKFWRRGIQDGDYLALAQRVNKKAVNKIIKRMVPKVLWEVGVDEKSDPTYVHADISWPTDPDAWEEARRELAHIIEQRH